MEVQKLDELYLDKIIKHMNHVTKKINLYSQFNDTIINQSNRQHVGGSVLQDYLSTSSSSRQNSTRIGTTRRSSSSNIDSNDSNNIYLKALELAYALEVCKNKKSSNNSCDRLDKTLREYEQFYSSIMNMLETDLVDRQIKIKNILLALDSSLEREVKNRIGIFNDYPNNSDKLTYIISKTLSELDPVQPNMSDKIRNIYIDATKPVLSKSVVFPDISTSSLTSESCNEILSTYSNATLEDIDKYKSFIHFIIKYEKTLNDQMIIIMDRYTKL